MFADVAWAIWGMQNKMAIEKKFPSNPTDTIYIGVSFLQNWKKLLKEEDWEIVGRGCESILHCLENFKPTSELSMCCLRVIV